MRRVRNLTYRNFLYIQGLIMDKGYSRTEAEVLTRNAFSNYSNPKGLSVTEGVKRMLTRDEYIEMMKGEEIC